MTTSAGFFDLDGILYNSYVWRALQRHHEVHRFKLFNLYAYLRCQIALWPLKNTGLLPEDSFYRTWGKNMAWVVRGVQLEGVQAIWDWVMDNEILPNLRPEMGTGFARHRARGHHVVLLSGTFQLLLDVVFARLSADCAVSTPFA